MVLFLCFGLSNSQTTEVRVKRQAEVGIGDLIAAGKLTVDLLSQISEKNKVSIFNKSPTVKARYKVLILVYINKLIHYLAYKIKNLEN